MEYYQQIQSALDYIEENMSEIIRIQDVSKIACYSPFHFQRIFQTVTGFSLQGYIRKRRLTLAAKALCQSDRSVIEIAQTYGYGSQEAFTRAFDALYGVTPVRYRKVEKPTAGVDKIDFLSLSKNIAGKLKMDKPCIEEMKAKYIQGFEYSTSIIDEQYFKDTAGFYDDFGKNAYFSKIKGSLTPAFAHGVSLNFEDDGQFSFVVGEEVSSPDEILEQGFVNVEIPEGRYAQFKINGSVELSQNTWRYIYGVWLPQSGYRRRDTPDYEIVDVCGSVYPNKMRIKIYIPIE